MEIVFKEPIQLKHLFSRHLKNDSFMNSPDNKLLCYSWVFNFIVFAVKVLLVKYIILEFSLLFFEHTKELLQLSMKTYFIHLVMLQLIINLRIF